MLAEPSKAKTIFRAHGLNKPYHPQKNLQKLIYSAIIKSQFSYIKVTCCSCSPKDSTHYYNTNLTQIMVELPMLSARLFGNFNYRSLGIIILLNPTQSCDLLPHRQYRVLTSDHPLTRRRSSSVNSAGNEG